MNKPSFLLELLKVGLPMGIMFCIEVAFFLALALFMGSLGSSILSANQVVMQYSGVLISIVFCIAQAITVRMGHLLGAKDIHSTARACYVGFFIATVFMLVCATFYWFFPDTLISIDFNIHHTRNLETVNYATQFFTIAAVFMILEAIRVSLFGALRGFKDTNFYFGSFNYKFLVYCFTCELFIGNSITPWWIRVLVGMVAGAASSVGLLFWRFKSKLRYYKANRESDLNVTN